MIQLFKSKFIIPVMIMLGILAGLSHAPYVMVVVDLISSSFINVLKLMSLPLIFLSILMTAFRFENVETFKTLGLRVLKYTLLTTVIAATVALILYLLMLPTTAQTWVEVIEETNRKGFLDYIAQTVPSNLFQPFIEGNVVAVLLLAALAGFGILSLSQEAKEPLKKLCSSLYAVVIHIVGGIIVALPLGIFAFVAQFVHESSDLKALQPLAVYLACIVLANLIQAIVVLPVLVKAKGLSPIQLVKHMWPALSVAFFTKSSAAALPVALKCAHEKAKMKSEIAQFSLPLCTTINMNACAAFILITVLFVGSHYGLNFSAFEYVAWIFIATLAAVGNAGVPMGCYFLATSLLAALEVPVQMMAIILPAYTLIDMLESAINVWSDSCVTAIVDQESKGCAVTLELLKQENRAS